LFAARWETTAEAEWGEGMGARVATNENWGSAAALASIRQLGWLLALLAILAMAPATAGAQERPGDRNADYSEFYEALEPYGIWIVHRDYGYVWSPDAAEEDEDWRPYTRGHWVRTHEHGWYWVSDEPFGWATYHYGRWLKDEELGWIWIPGSEWAPAWVAWRHSDDYIGWAPLPPDTIWEPDRERLVFRSYTLEEPWFSPYWVFVRPRFIASRRLDRFYVPLHRNPPIVRSTTFVTSYNYVDRRIYNRGLDFRLVEQRARRPVPLVRLTPVDAPREFGMRAGRGSVVNVYRPRFAAASAPGAPRNVFTPQAVTLGTRGDSGGPARPPSGQGPAAAGALPAPAVGTAPPTGVPATGAGQTPAAGGPRAGGPPRSPELIEQRRRFRAEQRQQQAGTSAATAPRPLPPATGAPAAARPPTPTAGPAPAPAPAQAPQATPPSPPQTSTPPAVAAPASPKPAPAIAQPPVPPKASTPPPAASVPPPAKPAVPPAVAAPQPPPKPAPAIAQPPVPPKPSTAPPAVAAPHAPPKPAPMITQPPPPPRPQLPSQASVPPQAPRPAPVIAQPPPPPRPQAPPPRASVPPPVPKPAPVAAPPKPPAVVNVPQPARQPAAPAQAKPDDKKKKGQPQDGQAQPPR
jgi:hypothetical protein